ncbi:hypothetical protein BDZ85DRAFT_255618 [Elsinoe ampelina]|uniref:Uncharacterized protein n=1 Tax=Elsinoe ampelina TaxID=302913 RepID=A0A6A6GR46_9PEZI|nr:hypothetical protein BDZ85DRAFT_255618 [Elsinoe ampelina]
MTSAMRSIFVLAIGLLRLTSALAIDSAATDLDARDDHEDLPEILLEMGRTYQPGEIRELQLKAKAEQAAGKTKNEARSLAKRTIVVRTLNAKWSFFCPIQTSTVTREFEWSAYWFSNDRTFHITGHKNVDGFKNLRNDRLSFDTVFYHTFCVASGTRVCTYHFEGYISGLHDADHLSMEMTIAGNFPGIILPTVRETCVNIRSGQCAAANSVGGGLCTNRGIDVTVPQNH